MVFSEVTGTSRPDLPGALPWAGLEQSEGPGNQQYKQELSLLMPKAEGEPLLLVYDLNGVAAGQSVTCICESGLPQYWQVALRPVPNSRASCYNGPEASGIPFRLGGGGSLKVPAKSEFFTIVVEAGSAAIVGTVIATRKVEVTISGGSV